MTAISNIETHPMIQQLNSSMNSMGFTNTQYTNHTIVHKTYDVGGDKTTSRTMIN